MSWLGDLLAKFPTMKGIGAFVYVATHWSSISNDLEQYRHQIKDREEWAKRMLEQQHQLSELEQEHLRREKEAWAESAIRTLSDFKGAVATVKDLVARLEEAHAMIQKKDALLEKTVIDLLDALTLIARLLSQETPLYRSLVLGALNPRARAIAELLLKHLPPVDATVLDLGDLAEVRASSLRAALEPRQEG